MAKYARVSLVCFIALVLQASVAAQLPIAGARADLVLLAAIAAGLAAGPEAGAGVGFGAGLVLDLMASGPVGLSSLVYTVVGYTVGLLNAGVLRSSKLIPIASAAAASAAGVLFYALGGEVLGQESLMKGNLGIVILVVSAVNAVLVLPATRLMRWAFTEPKHDYLNPRGMW
jgi:rod shape-determining protein MreD